MASVVVSGDTSGSVSLSAPAVAGTTTLTLPTFNGTVGLLVSGTSVASTSGTSIDFTSLPAGVRRITVMFNNVSTNGSANYLLQIGDSGGIESTGYTSSSTATTTASGISYSTAGFVLRVGAAAVSLSGALRFNSMGSNIWVAEGTFSDYASTFGIVAAAGNKTLSDVLDRVRITTTTGTDTFDAGSINIMYE
jgi:hypothetical protein